MPRASSGCERPSPSSGKRQSLGWSPWPARRRPEGRPRAPGAERAAPAARGRPRPDRHRPSASTASRPPAGRREHEQVRQVVVEPTPAAEMHRDRSRRRRRRAATSASSRSVSSLSLGCRSIRAPAALAAARSSVRGGVEVADDEVDLAPGLDRDIEAAVGTDHDVGASTRRPCATPPPTRSPGHVGRPRPDPNRPVRRSRCRRPGSGPTPPATARSGVATTSAVSVATSLADDDADDVAVGVDGGTARDAGRRS